MNKSNPTTAPISLLYSPHILFDNRQRMDCGYCRWPLRIGRTGNLLGVLPIIFMAFTMRQKLHVNFILLVSTITAIPLAGPNRSNKMADLGAFNRPSAALTTQQHPMIASQGGRLGDRQSPLR